MRHAPRNPKTEPDRNEWDIVYHLEEDAKAKNRTGEDWCVRTATPLSRLRIPQPDSRKHVRCTRCSRRLLVSVINCVGGEFVCWAMPPHKKPVKKQRTPRRERHYAGRGR